jgi:hypothetical protein
MGRRLMVSFLVESRDGSIKDGFGKADQSIAMDLSRWIMTCSRAGEKAP